MDPVLSICIRLSMSCMADAAELGMLQEYPSRSCHRAIGGTNLLSIIRSTDKLIELSIALLSDVKKISARVKGALFIEPHKLLSFPRWG